MASSPVGFLCRAKPLESVLTAEETVKTAMKPWAWLQVSVFPELQVAQGPRSQNPQTVSTMRTSELWISWRFQSTFLVC